MDQPIRPKASNAHKPRISTVSEGRRPLKSYGFEVWLPVVGRRYSLFCTSMDDAYRRATDAIGLLVDVRTARASGLGLMVLP